MPLPRCPSLHPHHAPLPCAAKEVAISTYAAELASANNKVSEFAMELSAKSSVASELQEQVSQLQAKLLDASQRDMDAQKAQDELQQELSDLRCAALSCIAV